MIVQPGRLVVVIVDNHRPCKRCGSTVWQVLPPTPRKPKQTERCNPCTLETGRRHRATDRSRARRQEYYQKNKLRQAAQRDARRLDPLYRLAERGRNHHLSGQQVASLIDNQNGRCAACAEDLDFDHPRRVHIDHDHACCPGSYSCGRCVRGLLCHSCNRIAVDVARVEAVATYLRRWSPSLSN